MSFPVFSRRFSVSLAISIDTFFQVSLKVFTLSVFPAKTVYSFVKMDKQDSGFFVWQEWMSLNGTFILISASSDDGRSYHPNPLFGLAKVFHYFHLFPIFSYKFCFSTSFSVALLPCAPMPAPYIRCSYAAFCNYRSVCIFLSRSLHAPEN